MKAICAALLAPLAMVMGCAHEPKLTLSERFGAIAEQADMMRRKFFLQARKFSRDRFDARLRITCVESRINHVGLLPFLQLRANELMHFC